jgi:serine/threonine protein kinase
MLCPSSYLYTYRSDFQKIVSRILRLDYKVPEKLHLTDDVKELLSQIFVKDAAKRITISQIKQHPWYLHRLPWELSDGYQGFDRCVMGADSYTHACCIATHCFELS